MSDNANVLIVPSGLPGLASFQLDLTEVNRVEKRIPEIAVVTPTKAPELLASFNVAFLEASRMAIRLEEELVRAKRSVDRVRSIIVLDRVPRILSERGLATAKSPAGSEDLRKAVIDGDVEYQQAADACNAIECYLMLLKNKAKGIEMAYNSVKRILGEQAFNYSGHVADVPLSSGAPSEAGVGQVETKRNTQGFGKSKF